MNGRSVRGCCASMSSIVDPICCFSPFSIPIVPFKSGLLSLYAYVHSSLSDIIKSEKSLRIERSSLNRPKLHTSHVQFDIESMASFFFFIITLPLCICLIELLISRRSSNEASSFWVETHVLITAWWISLERWKGKIDSSIQRRLITCFEIISLLSVVLLTCSSSLKVNFFYTFQ